MRIRCLWRACEAIVPASRMRFAGCSPVRCSHLRCCAPLRPARPSLTPPRGRAAHADRSNQLPPSRLAPRRKRTNLHGDPHGPISGAHAKCLSAVDFGRRSAPIRTRSTNRIGKEIFTPSAGLRSTTNVMTNRSDQHLGILLFVPAEQSSRQSAEDEMRESHRGCGHVNAVPFKRAGYMRADHFPSPRRACKGRRVHTCTESLGLACNDIERVAFHVDGHDPVPFSREAQHIGSPEPLRSASNCNDPAARYRCCWSCHGPVSCGSPACADRRVLFEAGIGERVSIETARR